MAAVFICIAYDIATLEPLTNKLAHTRYGLKTSEREQDKLTEEQNTMASVDSRSKPEWAAFWPRFSSHNSFWKLHGSIQ